MTLSKVCPRCQGKGRIYQRGTHVALARIVTCPECRGSTAGVRAEVLNALDHCWARFRAGETGDFNIELAIRRAIRSGLTNDELRGRGIPARIIDRAAGGQDRLL